MLLFIKLIFILLLFIVVLQDFSRRSIYWWLPVLLFFVSFAMSYMSIGLHAIAINASVNFCTALLLLSVVALYILIRYKSLRAFASNHFGLGDILMMLALCPLMPPVNFILFMCLSHILMLIAELLKRFFLPSRETTIPYAGYLALFLSCWTLLTFCLPDINFLTDYPVYFILSATP